MVIWSTCNGIGTPIVAAMRAIKKLEQQGVILRVTQCHIWEIDQEANNRCEAMLRFHEVPGHIVFHGDVKSFPSVAQLQTRRNDVVHLVLTGTPCQAISRAAKMSAHRTKFGLHAAPSNIWHGVFHGIKQLQQQVGQANMIVFSENVIPANGRDLAELDAQAGFRCTMAPDLMEGNSRPRFLWTSLPLPKMQVPSRNEESRCPPCLRTCFPQMFGILPTNLRCQSRIDRLFLTV